MGPRLGYFKIHVYKILNTFVDEIISFVLTRALGKK